MDDLLTGDLVIPQLSREIEPTMADSDVLAFCRDGYILLEAVVPDDINRRVLDFYAEPKADADNSLLQEDWFVDAVILNEAAAGIIRSLLGRDFYRPVMMHNHRTICPSDKAFGWHVDGGSLYGPPLNDLQVFYYPQDTPLELGPTEVLPGSHFLRSQQRMMAHYDSISGAQSTASSAGSIFITAYQIWHRAASASASGVRNLLKYCYARQSPPTGDWVRERDFDARFAYFGGAIPFAVEQFRDDRDIAAMYLWLCGNPEFGFAGGQSWPVPGTRIGPPYGLPQSLRR